MEKGCIASFTCGAELAETTCLDVFDATVPQLSGPTGHPPLAELPAAPWWMIATAALFAWSSGGGFYFLITVDELGLCAFAAACSRTLVGDGKMMHCQLHLRHRVG